MTAPEPPLHLIVIGGGLCGLSAAIATRLAGHKITVLEAVSALREVGAGLQITPNGTRLLQAWGLENGLVSKAASPEYLRFRRFDGTLLAERTRYREEIAERYGFPSWCLHRADLQIAMAERAEELGIEIKLGCRAVDVQEDILIQGDGEGRMVVSTEEGQELRGDIVLAADGVWSELRQKLVGEALKPRPTGNLAYRILLDRESVRSEELEEWLQKPGINVWVGPGKHVVAYSIKGGQWLNLVLLVNDDLPENVMRAQGDLTEMKTLFQGWDPILNKFLDHVEKVDKWRLNYLEPLPFWKSSSGRFLLAGDCAHPMLPYMAQGANSSLEDGATIGALLSKVRRRDQIADATNMYDTIRRPRVDHLVQETFKQAKEHHLPDGPEQRKRDLEFRKSFESNNTWTHPKIQSWIYDYDAYAKVDETYDGHGF